MSRARAAELGLVGIAAVWGLTFVMVQDAVEELPVTAFLAYRFIPASLLVALLFRARLAALGRDGWRAGLAMGIFLTGGYLFQTLGLERTTASNAGFITGMFVVLTPVAGALVLGERTPNAAWAAAAVKNGLRPPPESDHAVSEMKSPSLVRLILVPPTAITLGEVDGHCVTPPVLPEAKK